MEGVGVAEPHLLSVVQVADRLDVHIDTVRRWLRSGELRGILLGDRAGWRVEEEELARFLAAHKPAGQADGC